MRFIKALRLVLILALGVASARASAPVRLVVPGIPYASAVYPLVLPVAAAGLIPTLFVSPASLVPSLLAVPAQASLPLVRPVTTADRPSLIDSLNSLVSDAPAKENSASNYEGFFDGAFPAQDGDTVYPRIVMPGNPTLLLPLQLNAVRTAVERALPALRESVARGDWNGPNTTLDESCCGDAAPKLAVLLRAQGIPARLVEAEFHYYVMLDLPDGQIIVDPTVRQFFGKKQAPKSVAQIFVGSIAELHALFRQHAGSKTTRYDPQRIYFRESLVREDALLALEARVRTGGDAVHDPIRRFLGLPPAAPRPPDAPRLIIR
ncbi:MAG: hypothetical protein AAB268_08795 [Elusimicrobiota bacterium]